MQIYNNLTSENEKKILFLLFAQAVHSLNVLLKLLNNKYEVPFLQNAAPFEAEVEHADLENYAA